MSRGLVVVGGGWSALTAVLLALQRGVRPVWLAPACDPDLLPRPFPPSATPTWRTLWRAVGVEPGAWRDYGGAVSAALSRRGVVDAGFTSVRRPTAAGWRADPVDDSWAWSEPVPDPPSLWRRALAYLSERGIRPQRHGWRWAIDGGLLRRAVLVGGERWRGHRWWIAAVRWRAGWQQRPPWGGVPRAGDEGGLRWWRDRHGSVVWWSAQATEAVWPPGHAHPPGTATAPWGWPWGFVLRRGWRVWWVPQPAQVPPNAWWAGLHASLAPLLAAG